MRSNKVINNFDIIKEYVIKLSGREDTEKLELQIECYINEILAYLNRECVCECLELPIAQAIVDELDRKDFTTKAIGCEGNITSYKEGDLSISLGSVDSVTVNGSTVKYGGKLEGFKLITGLKRCSG